MKILITVFLNLNICVVFPHQKGVKMGHLGVYYSDLIPVLIKAIQEQQAIIESLRARIESPED